MSYRASAPIKTAKGITTGYILMDDLTGETKPIKSEDIKQALINKSIEIYNLKLTQDGKLIHVDSLDKVGLTVTPQQFFSGKVGEWSISHIKGNEQKFRAKHSSERQFILGYKLSNNNRSYVIYLTNDTKFNSTINRDSIEVAKNLENILNKLLTYRVQSQKVQQVKKFELPPGIIYETSARTEQQFLSSNSNNGIHAYNSMEYWWSLNSEERAKERTNANSPWYNFGG